MGLLSGPGSQACVGRFYDVETGALQLRQWSNPSFSDSGTAYSFDDVGSALLTLFEVSSLHLMPLRPALGSQPVD